MLKLLNITKDYKVGDQVVHALREIDLEFGESGFVSILGQSGCGKTMLMNVIGGLDRYTTGDVVIDGVSTKDYSERDWNTYRNDVVGFVFQSYNLIPHMTVLANVELALTLSGIKGAERKERSLAMLEKVGLKEQAHKRPNQLSGGQCQRVAIARALFLYRARRDISRRRHYASCDGEKERKKNKETCLFPPKSNFSTIILRKSRFATAKKSKRRNSIIKIWCSGKNRKIISFCTRIR